MAGCHRDPRAIRVRAHLALRSPRPGREKRRDRQQHPHVSDPPALPQQRIRPHRHPAAGLRQFAEYQPFTPVTQTVRGLLTDTSIGTHAVGAVAWSVGIALVCYLWALRLYNRRRAADPK